MESIKNSRLCVHSPFVPINIYKHISENQKNKSFIFLKLKVTAGGNSSTIKMLFLKVINFESNIYSNLFSLEFSLPYSATVHSHFSWNWCPPGLLLETLMLIISVLYIWFWEFLVATAIQIKIWISRDMMNIYAQEFQLKMNVVAIKILQFYLWNNERPMFSREHWHSNNVFFQQLILPKCFIFIAHF